MRPNVDSTQLIPRPVWENPRVHLLDDIWLLTIVAILLISMIVLTTILKRRFVRPTEPGGQE